MEKKVLYMERKQINGNWADCAIMIGPDIVKEFSISRDLPHAAVFKSLEKELSGSINLTDKDDTFELRVTPGFSFDLGEVKTMFKVAKKSPLWEHYFTVVEPVTVSPVSPIQIYATRKAQLEEILTALPVSIHGTLQALQDAAYAKALEALPVLNEIENIKYTLQVFNDMRDQLDTVKETINFLKVKLTELENTKAPKL